jgi:hypothetical protein
MAAIARYEIKNARATIELVEYDSRLGWEPSMGYVADKSRLLWKIKQLENVLQNEILNNNSKFLAPNKKQETEENECYSNASIV